MTDEQAAEFYRDKLVDWMMSQDIPTGSEAPGFDDLLEIIATYIASLKEYAKSMEE